jgi:hypothetical protein
MMGDKTLFQGRTPEEAKANAQRAGYTVIGVSFNREKGYWVAFARKNSVNRFV